jgi:hypothetical protein
MENKMQFYFFDIKNIEYMINILLDSEIIHSISTTYKIDYVQPSFSDQNKQVILYEHKKYPVLIFNNNIY